MERTCFDKACSFNKVLKYMVQTCRIKGIQKQLFTVLLQNKCLENFTKFSVKTPYAIKIAYG